MKKSHEFLIQKRKNSGFTMAGSCDHYPADLLLEPVHLEIKANLYIEEEKAEMELVHSFKANCEGVRGIELNGVDFYQLKVLDLSKNKLESSYDGEKLKLFWSNPFTKGEERKVKISYLVEKPKAGMYFSYPDKNYPNKPLHVFTDHETERARHWLATVDLPNVRPKLDFHITANEKLSILANGELKTEKKNKNGTKTSHWHLDFPCPSYLTNFTAGDYIEYDDGDFEGIPIKYFTVKYYKPEDLKRSFGRTGKMLSWMTKKLDMPFPYPKYYQFAVPSIGGAMENISLVSWDDVFVLDEKLAKEWVQLVDIINLHEMAHSYFGDAIVCRDYSQAWLKESWAVYMEHCYIEDHLSAEDYNYNFYLDSHNYFAEADGSYKRPIVTRNFNSSWQMYDRHLYPGGACRIHTLRNEIGDEAFWAATKEYVKTFHKKVVETDDFRKLLEKHSGRSLGRLFDQWFFKADYPNLKIKFDFNAESKLGCFEIEQTQAKGKDEEAFYLSIDLAWVFKGNLITKSVKLNKAKQSFMFPMEKDPEQLRINPFAKTLVKYDFDPGSQKLINQMQKAEDVSGRIIAIKKLAEKSGYGNLSAIEKAYKKEAFYGVRCEAVKALTKNASLKARDILVSIIAKENDFRVQTSLMASLIGFKDETISKAVEKRVKKEELGTWASCYAYQVLGSQWENAPTELLNSLAEKKTYKAFDQGGAIKALGLSRNKELLDLIIEKSKYGSSDERTRHFYNESLGYLSKGLEPSDKDKVFKTLLTGLRDPHSKVRSSAVSALGILGETRAIRHLDSYMKDLSVQDKVDIRELIESIQGREKSIEKGLKKQVGDLAQKLKELEEKLEKIKANKKAKKEKKNKDKEDKKAKKEKKEKEKEAKKKKEKKDKKK